MAARYQFKYQSLQETEAVTEYLEALAAGLRAGKLRLSKEERTVELKPQGLVRFALGASEGDLQSRVVIKLAWRNPESADDARKQTLQIDGGAE
jgi:amphi-Trp domain-containing protein